MLLAKADYNHVCAPYFYTIEVDMSIKKEISSPATKTPSKNREAINPVDQSNLAINGGYNQSGKTILTNVDITKIQEFIANIELEKANGYWSIQGLPKNLHPAILNTMIYQHGALVAFNSAQGRAILPFKYGKDLDFYGLPTEINPIPFVSKREFNDQIKLTPYVDCAIWLDTTPTVNNYAIQSRMSQSQYGIGMMATTLHKLMITVVSHCAKPIFRTNDKEVLKQLHNVMQAMITSGSPAGVISSFGEGTIEMFEIGNQTYTGQELMATYKDLQGLLDTFNGLVTTGSATENDNMVSGQLAGIQEQCEVMAQSRIASAKYFEKQCRELLGWHDFTINATHQQRQLSNTDAPKENIGENVDENQLDKD